MTERWLENIEYYEWWRQWNELVWKGTYDVEIFRPCVNKKGLGLFLDGYHRKVPDLIWAFKWRLWLFKGRSKIGNKESSYVAIWLSEQCLVVKAIKVVRSGQIWNIFWWYDFWSLMNWMSGVNVREGEMTPGLLVRATGWIVMQFKQQSHWGGRLRDKW